MLFPDTGVWVYSQRANFPLGIRVIGHKIVGGPAKKKSVSNFFYGLVSSMLFPDTGGDAPVPSSMLFPDSGFEILRGPPPFSIR